MGKCKNRLRVNGVMGRCNNGYWGIGILGIFKINTILAKAKIGGSQIF
jgi:hypothetical protein